MIFILFINILNFYKNEKVIFKLYDGVGCNEPDVGFLQYEDRWGWG